MNFPDKQRTGRVAEIKVEQVFTAWSWTVGHDHIDTGYDMFVEPEISLFKGHRFLVQVKATSQSKRKPVAKVKRSRLRDYARSPYPVILVWMAADEKTHWIHMQPWIERNMGRLEGDGEAGVPLPRDQTLDDKEALVAYLLGVMKPSEEGKDALPKLAESRSRKLSAIDPRLQVRVGLKDGRESYEIFATDRTIKLGFEAKAKPSEENADGLMKAIRYGLPAAIEVDSLSLKGSDLFSAIGADGNFRGRMSIRPLATRDGTVNLYAGTSYSVLAAAYSLPATLYRGRDGFAISNEDQIGFLCFRLLGDIDATGNASIKVTFGAKGERIMGIPIQSLDALAPLGEWAGEARRKNAIYIDLAFDVGRLTMAQQGNHIEALDPLLHYLFLLGRLHKVAKALNSDFAICPDLTLSEEEVSDLQFAYQLLKGERVNGKVGTIEFVGQAPEGLGKSGNFYAETAYELSMAGQLLGLLPMAIDLNNYAVDRDADGSSFRLTPSPESDAVFHHNSLGPLDARVTRTRLPRVE